MYQPTQPLLFSWSSDHEDVRGFYELLYGNGSYLRSLDFKKRYKVTKKEESILFQFTVGDRVFHGSITDNLLVSRITEYMRKYYGKKFTNCSAFANFLTTGVFIECEEERRLFVLTQGMRAYKGEKIRVGDMLCVMYAQDTFWRSRESKHHGAYIKSKKKRHDTKEYTHALSPRNDVMSAKEIEEVCQSPVIADYHFMVCVAKDPEGPVWLSQRGFYQPSDQPIPLVFTVGNKDPYYSETPLLVFLKRRRKLHP